ncbi:MAG: hypothetical protein ABWZ40_06770 [Caulobacterales bacterium]
MQVPVKETPWEGAYPDIPNWSENFCLAGFDPKCGVGFWFHLGRYRRDLDMWRELVVVRFPDGTAVGHRAIGNARAAKDGPGGPCYAIRVLESGRKLSYSFSGGVLRQKSEDMLKSLVPQGLTTPMTFELVFESDSEIWDLHKVGTLQDFLPSGHIEQPGRLTGSFKIGNETYPFDALVNRDHSLGPRDNKDLKNHQWHQGYFENGIAFMLFDAQTRSDGKTVFSEAVVYEGDKMYEAELDFPWRCDAQANDKKPVGFSLTYEKGTLQIETDGFKGDSYLSLASPNDMYTGVYPSKDGVTMVLAEQSVALRLNGSVKGYGVFERTIPGIIRAEP